MAGRKFHPELGADNSDLGEIPLFPLRRWPQSRFSKSRRRIVSRAKKNRIHRTTPSAERPFAAESPADETSDQPCSTESSEVSPL